MLKKIFGSLVLKSVYAICIGIFTVTLFSTLLSAYGGAKDPVPSKQAIAKHIDFPENQAMLEKMSIQLNKEGIMLSEISPGAGE